MRSTDAVAAAWKSAAFLEYDWRPAACAPVRPGHGGGAAVTNDWLEGRPAYLKPRTERLGHGCAAREKIASDLGRAVGVTVPPVVLTSPPDWWDGCAEVAASLVMFDHQVSWGLAKQGIARVLRGENRAEWALLAHNAAVRDARRDGLRANVEGRVG